MNGCYNRAPLKPTVRMQDGWHEYWDKRVPKMVEVPFRNSPDCEYSKHDRYNDQNCKGCKHDAKANRTAD